MNDNIEFPIDLMPPRIRDAIEAQAAMGNYHLPSVATAALAIASHAAQGLYDIDFLARPSTVPASIFAMICAPSGSAKSSLFEPMLAGVRQWQHRASDVHRLLLADYEVDRRLYERQRLAAEKENDRDTLIDLERRKPRPPRSPQNVSSKITTNGLFRSLHDDWPTHAVFTPEGASLLKGYSLNAKNAPEEFGGALASLWSGEMIDRTTGDQRMILRDRRLSMLVMVQESVAEEFLSSEALEGQGLLARFLVVNAPTWHPLDEDFTAPDHRERKERLLRRMDRFHGRIDQMLSEPLATRDGQDGELDLPTMTWTREAAQVMRSFQTEALAWNHSETENWFRRSFEHAVRLSGVLAIFEDEEAISEATARAGVALTRFYAAQLRQMDVAPINERHAQYHQYIAPALKKFRASPNGLTMRELYRTIWKKLDPDHRGRILETMERDELITKEKVRKGTNEIVIYRLGEGE